MKVRLVLFLSGCGWIDICKDKMYTQTLQGTPIHRAWNAFHPIRWWYSVRGDFQAHDYLEL